MAYKLLRNAGYAPPELEECKEIHSLLDMLETCSDETEKMRQMHKLHCLLRKVSAHRQRPVSLEENDPYFQQVLERVRVLERQMANSPCSLSK